MDKRLDQELVVKYLKYLYATIDSLYYKRDLNKKDIESFIKEFNRFKEKVNQESRISPSFKRKLNSLKFEIKRNPRKSNLRHILEKFFFFINFNSISMLLWYDDISKKDRKIMVEEIRNQMSHFIFDLKM